MIVGGFEQSGTIFVKNREECEEVMQYYMRIFGMEKVHYHMEERLKINGKIFFGIREVDDELYTAYRTIANQTHVFNSSACYDTKDEVDEILKKFSDEGSIPWATGIHPWCPYYAYVNDKYSVGWYISVRGHLPCSDCKKSDCEGDWDTKCRLPKWTEELYKQHGTDWYKHV